MERVCAELLCTDLLLWLMVYLQKHVIKRLTGGLSLPTVH